MTQPVIITKEVNSSASKSSTILNGDLESKVEEYKNTALKKIRFTVIYKPAIISFVALIISFFIDVSAVPVLGNISMDLAKNLFPNWKPGTVTIVPYHFWWLPIIVYVFFFLLAHMAFNKLKDEVNRTPVTETIDGVINAYTSIIDSISTALPLIGAAILLLSIRLGEEIFIGFSVPFEIKALIVLALGKLFEPVLDQLGYEFQNVVTNIQDIKEKYFSQLQIANAKNVEKQSNGKDLVQANVAQFTAKDLENYKAVMEHTSQLSSIILKNFNAVYVIFEKLNANQSITLEKIEQLKSLSESVVKASSSLSDEKTLTGLKYLESIVVKK